MTDYLTISSPQARDAYSYRRDPHVPAFPDDHPIVVYDGNCRLCSGSVRFLLRHDRRAALRFIAAQSALGQALYHHYGLDPVNYGTYVLLEQGRAWLRSEATLRLLSHLGLPWSLGAMSRVLPTRLRDRLYDMVARNRLRWFGVRQACYLLEPGQEHRFLD